MSDFHQIGEEIKLLGSPYDVVRRNYIRQLSDYTGRNTILYYSGWLQKNVNGIEINDGDKNGLMTVVHNLDTSKGLDLILHTPGGQTAATESFVEYIYSIFGNNVRAIVPQLAMSAGTLIACSCSDIIMGKESSLGPIDPQMGDGTAAHAIVEEFNRAYSELQKALDDAAREPENPSLGATAKAKLSLWQPIIAKYNPTIIGECEKAIDWCESMAKSWLTRNILSSLNEIDREQKLSTIIKELGDHSVNKNHGRHLSLDKCKEIGLNITSLEDDPKLQDLVLSVHYSCIYTFIGTQAVKIIENQNSVSFINTISN